MLTFFQNEAQTIQKVTSRFDMCGIVELAYSRLFDKRTLHPRGCARLRFLQKTNNMCIDLVVIGIYSVYCSLIRHILFWEINIMSVYFSGKQYGGGVES